MDVANAIAVRCTTADDSVATACAAGFYLAADDTCLGMHTTDDCPNRFH
jgi:hypothetical protein